MIGEMTNPIFLPTLEIAKSSVMICPFVSIPNAIIEISCFDSCGKSPVSFAALIAAWVDCLSGSLILSLFVSSNVPSAS